MIHIFTHAFVKASAFILSRIKIGMTGTQDMRMWGMDNGTLGMVLSFLILIGIGGGIISCSKELVMLQVTMVLIVVIG